MVYTKLISVADLAAQLDRPGWVICDCRHDLARFQAGRLAYEQSHVPGAHFVHLDADLSGPKTGLNGRHPLPHPQTFALRAAALGIDNRTQVVAYDASGGCYAARLWWMLRWIGHEAVAVLDGGWEAWLAGNHPLTTVVPPAKPVVSTARIQAQAAVDSAFVSAHLAGATVCVLDARSPDRYAGQNEHLDPVAGHIPGALNRFYRLNLDAAGCFRSADDLRRDFLAVLGKRDPGSVIHQCGSGVTACHNLLAMEVAGLTGSRLYPGSWSEWVSDRTRPVASGTR